jgi:hypothetical protein
VVADCLADSATGSDGFEVHSIKDEFLGEVDVTFGRTTNERDENDDELIETCSIDCGHWRACEMRTFRALGVTANKIVDEEPRERERETAQLL